MFDIHKLLYRFIHVDIGYHHSKRNNKGIRKKRLEGIPQGGIISGMLANIYLHLFDSWVMTELKKVYDIRYTRYADDFIILAKNDNEIGIIKELCRDFLNDIGLTLHQNPKKQKF